MSSEKVPAVSDSRAEVVGSTTCSGSTNAQHPPRFLSSSNKSTTFIMSEDEDTRSTSNEEQLCDSLDTVETLNIGESEQKSDYSSEEESPKKKQLLSLFQSSSVLVNYISIGYILLPAGFAVGGTYWTAVCLTFVAFQSYISGIFVLESCARAEALENVEETLDSASQHSSVGQHPRRAVAVKKMKFELSELCRYFMGRRLRNFFTLTTACDLYGLTWALSAVFACKYSTSLVWP
jgi:hypothetical protein